jgi:hypothetical protein
MCNVWCYALATAFAAAACFFAAHQVVRMFLYYRGF